MKKMAMIAMLLVLMLSTTACSGLGVLNNLIVDTFAKDDVFETEDYSLNEDSYDDDSYYDESSGLNPDGSVIGMPRGEVVQMYELSDITYVKDSGEEIPGECIPGSEVYIFTEGENIQDFEYRSKYYATYDDMLKDNYYDIKSVYGSYTYDEASNSLALIGLDGSFREARFEDDKMIIDVGGPELPAVMRVTYTATEDIDI